jgi:anaerobic carbon-monoxide dehydrogenase iron sulfur subunit
MDGSNLKTLNIHPNKCNGCGDCESACSLKHAGIKYPGRSCIRIIQECGDGNFFLPTTCNQCEDPPCLAACPKEAIYRDNQLNRVMIDNDRCVGCQMCVSACPVGAMGFAKNRGKAFKCTLCGGDPACVRACPEKALEYSEPDRLPYPQMAQTALKLAGMGRRKGNA